VRRLWPEVVDGVKARRRVTWIQLSQHAQVVGVDGTTLTLGFNNPGARESFVNGRSDLIVQQVLIDLVGQEFRVEAIVDPSAQPGTEAPIRASGPRSTPSAPPPAPASPATPAASSAAERPEPEGPPAWATDGPEPEPRARSSADEAAVPPRPTEPAGPPAPADDSAAHRDDPDIEDGLDGPGLLTERLGAQVIEEIPNR
jgi:DNA polymerase-3 subunit gamma/tau